MAEPEAEEDLVEQAATEAQAAALERAQEEEGLAGQAAPELQGEAQEELPVVLRALAAPRAQRRENGSPRQHCCEPAQQRGALAVPWAWAAVKRVAARTR